MRSTLGTNEDPNTEITMSVINLKIEVGINWFICTFFTLKRSVIKETTVYISEFIDKSFNYFFTYLHNYPSTLL